MTVKIWPPTVIVPVRSVVSVLAATLNVIVPLPDPLAAPVMVSQLALLDADHAHPEPVDTLNELEPPAFGMDFDAGEIA